jgi:hypothetical protein
MRKNKELIRIKATASYERRYFWDGSVYSIANKITIFEG